MIGARGRYNSRLPARHGSAPVVTAHGLHPNTPATQHGRAVRETGHTAALAHRTGRSFVTEARQTGADVRSLTDTLIARAAANGGQLTSAEVAQTVESAEVTPAQAKKLLRSLAEAGVTVVVDGSANSRRRVAAARAATPASKATTAKAAPARAKTAVTVAPPGRASDRRPEDGAFTQPLTAVESDEDTTAAKKVPVKKAQPKAPP